MSYEQPTLNELARDMLRQMMSDFSEDGYCAGWMHENEYRLWEALTNPEHQYGFITITDSEIARMRHLHERSGGWWIWAEGEESPRFVTTEEWIAILAKYRPG